MSYSEHPLRTGRKLGIIQVTLAKRERFRYWWLGVRDAIFQVPPMERSDWVHFNPGDPGYDSAPIHEAIDAHPLRFTKEQLQ
jgi:hypothetical protein